MATPTKSPVRSGKSISRAHPPYDTGKVKIGLCYSPLSTWSPGRDAYRLQSALLARPVVRMTLWERARARFVAFLTLFWSHHEHL